MNELEAPQSLCKGLAPVVESSGSATSALCLPTAIKDGYKSSTRASHSAVNLNLRKSSTTISTAPFFDLAS